MAVVALGILLSARAQIAHGQSAGDLRRPAESKPFVLGPPLDGGPVVVHAGFHLHGINDIDDEAETFEFTGVLTFKWLDPRQAFDPSVEGVAEKVFQGNYQFNELSPGWFPQEVLINEAGTYAKDGVVLRVQPDGTNILVQTVDAVAKSELNMRRFPFDRHRLEAVFEVLGFDNREVRLAVASDAAAPAPAEIPIPQWRLSGTSLSTRDRSAAYAGRGGVASAFVVTFDVQRESFFIGRLVVFPLTMIVLLSFSVFWMDRSSLGDRVNISFIGILTGVAYQLVVSGLLPHISYVTWMNGFLNLSFLTVCATVVVNLAVGRLDHTGRSQLGNLIDRRCRWIFPLVYFSLNACLLAVTFLFF